jgi:hypothetical protein
LLQRGGRHLGDLPRSLVRQKEHRSVGLAIDQCQQTCPLTVALEHFQGGNDLQQVLLTANRKNDLSLLATTNDLDYIRSMRFRRRTNKLERRPHI